MTRSPHHDGPGPTANGAGRDRLRRFLTSERSGTAAVEFALVIIPFLMFVVAILQIALYHFATQALDDATRMASRRVMIGDVQVSGLTAAKFKTDVLCPALTFMLPCSGITVNVSPVARASDANLKTGIYAFIRPSIPDLIPVKLDGDNGDFCAAGPGTYMFIDVAYDYLSIAQITAGIFPNSGAAGSLVLRSTNFVFNEPFPNSSTPGC